MPQKFKAAILAVASLLTLARANASAWAAQQRADRKAPAAEAPPMSATQTAPALPAEIRSSAMAMHPNGTIFDWTLDAALRARPVYLVQMLIGREVRDLTINIEGLVLLDSRNLLQTDAIATLPSAVAQAALRDHRGGVICRVDKQDDMVPPVYDVFVLQSGRTSRVELMSDGSPVPIHAKAMAQASLSAG